MRIRNLKTEIYQYRDELKTLLQKDTEQDIQQDERENLKQYSYKTIRECVYWCQTLGVSSSMTGTVINRITESQSGKEMDRVPSRRCVEDMTREMGVISDIQVCIAILSSKCCTLGWDATSLDGSHLNGIYITTDSNENFLIRISRLARATAEHYTSQILDSLKAIASTYANYHEENPEDVLQKIYCKIYSTMSDRLPTNSVVAQNLQNEMGHITPLYCQVHPLDTMASATKKALKDNMKTTSSLAGNESAVGNVLYNISKLRYKAKGK